MARPLRTKEQIHFTEDLLSGRERILDAAVEQDLLSDLGSVDSAAKTLVSFRDCGCHGPVGGRCWCGAIDCEKCFGRCSSCSRPLCLRHSKFREDASGVRLRFCRQCHDGLAIKQRALSCLRFLVTPFLKARSDHGES